MSQINEVISALRPLQADFTEIVAEINNLWTQLRAIARTKLDERDQISALVRLSLTESIEKFQVCL
jgi:hypothetical protein